MQESEIYVQFGLLVRQHRERLGLSQAQVAQAIDLSRSSVANVETGRQHIPMHHLYSLARVLQVDVHALLPSMDGAPSAVVDREIQSSFELSEREQEAVAKVVGSMKPSAKTGAQ